MKRIILLDPSVGSTNLGDEILLRCARRELESVFHADCFFIPLPTHLQAFRLTDRIPPRPVLVEEIRNADYRFVCGTNLLSESLLRRTSPWHLNRPTAEILRGSILMGAGGAVPGADSRGFAAAYTKKLYRTVLSDRYIHSVRTSPTLQSMRGLAGIRALQTGCFSQWMLTPDFCRGIRTEKADTVVFTLTDYARDPKADRTMLSVLRRNYSRLVFFPQGLYDTDYLRSLGSTDGVEILPATVDAYEAFLSQNPHTDYVGTRFHGGIFAMRHKARCVLLSVDERMNDMKASVPQNILPRSAVPDLLEEKLRQPICTTVELDFDAIRTWKDQFADHKEEYC